ncbi:MAG: sugar phosphate isomerase/epimerase [Clostridiales Family XIII bacterium]|jgi:sugar phosphate isomerase/epimerase|nr:sugar phosphate isomerase/epimerase [Clostridiales Family XIII bacterium]
MRKIALCTGQWADLSLKELAKKTKEMGYDGVELATWISNLDFEKLAGSKAYADEIKDIFNKEKLDIVSLSCHIIGKCVGDIIDIRHNNFVPKKYADKPLEIKKWAIDSMLKIPSSAKNLGVDVVPGFMGSSIWKFVYSYPQTTEEMIEAGFEEIKTLWSPILLEFQKLNIKYALEVHPSEIAFDYYSTVRLLEKLKDFPLFGINFDPSHLYWQGVKPELFLEDFLKQNKIFHIHFKDSNINLDGRSGILSSHIDFGDLRRGWNFVSVGHGGVDFEKIIRLLNAYDYTGPSSIEWEDSGMEREFGAKDALRYIRKINFAPSTFKFDEAISSSN